LIISKTKILKIASKLKNNSQMIFNH